MSATRRLHTTPTHDGAPVEVSADDNRGSAASSVLTPTSSSPRRRTPRRPAAKSAEARATARKAVAPKASATKVSATKVSATTIKRSRSTSSVELAGRRSLALDEVPLQPKQRRKPSAAPQTPVLAPAVTWASAPAALSYPELLVATADSSLERMLKFALEQVHLPHQVFNSGTRILQVLLAMPVSGRAPIVVLDVDLPGVDGHSILERLGAERPDTFLIVVLSSHADESVQVRSLLAGAVDHLAKPFNVRVLLAKLQRWVAISGNRLLDHS